MKGNHYQVGVLDQDLFLNIAVFCIIMRQITDYHDI